MLREHVRFRRCNYGVVYIRLNKYGIVIRVGGDFVANHLLPLRFFEVFETFTFKASSVDPHADAFKAYRSQGQ